MTIDVAEIIKKVKSIEIKTRKLINTSLIGNYQSRFKGKGVEFDFVREYHDGDDIRDIDWNVTSRYGSPFVKKYIEDRENIIILAADISNSSKFGSSSINKKEKIAELSAVIATIAHLQKDKFGLFLFSSEVEFYLSPQKGRNHILRVIRELLFFESKHKGTSIKSMIEYLNRTQKKKVALFILSDFIDQNYQQSLLKLKKKHQVICVQVQDKRETELPSIGLIDVLDLEKNKTYLLDTSDPKQREYFYQKNQLKQNALEKDMKKMGIDFLQLYTEEPFEHKLIKFFKQRTTH